LKESAEGYSSKVTWVRNGNKLLEAKRLDVRHDLEAQVLLEDDGLVGFDIKLDRVEDNVCRRELVPELCPK
jgi:hypothetical protein